MKSSLFKHVSASPFKRTNRASRFNSLILGLVSILLLNSSLPDRLLAQTPSGTLIAVNQADANISIVDLKTAKEVARVPEGAVAGHEVAASLDGKIAYVPIYGDSSP
jgi:DNA-binding beta-propeller fold protein YncE